MDKWEYFVVQVDTNLPQLQPYLNQMGDQGWELVNLIPNVTLAQPAGFNNATSSQATALIAILKRKKTATA
jgi:hypothetical protein